MAFVPERGQKKELPLNLFNIGRKGDVSSEIYRGDSQ